MFGIGPFREIRVFFRATDSAYAEIQRVLQIMIPDIRLTLDGPLRHADHKHENGKRDGGID